MSSEKRLQEYIDLVKTELNGILRENLYEISLGEKELGRIRRSKKKLRDAIKNCGVGDDKAKNTVKNRIRDILIEKAKITDIQIEEMVPVRDGRMLTTKDKFDIILFWYKKKYGKDGFAHLVEKYHLLSLDDTNGYEITKNDIVRIYDAESIVLSKEDKLQIMIQKIYEKYLGLGVVDELRDMKIDGISGGVSGGDGQNDSIWMFWKGNNVHLSFLEFESQKELERVCMNICRYNNPGQLSMNKGYIVNEMKDHSRVVVTRPPFTESFAFFVRKFDTIEKKRIPELIVDEGNEIVEECLKWIVKGCQIAAITGAQGSGKTTLLMALIGYIHPAYTLRVQEQAFELHLRDTYPKRNILSFQETDFITGQEGLDIQKKTDGVVNILGEVATAPVAAWLIQVSMVASLFTMFTHHAKDTDALIKYMRNCLLSCGAFHNEIIAQEQVVDVLRFDIHMEKDLYGHRYIERITEIIPVKNDNTRLYEIRNIVVFENGKYVAKEDFSSEMKKEIRKHLTKDEKEEFDASHSI